MNERWAWGALLATMVLPAAYELVMARARRGRPDAHARTAHARLRQDWLDAVSAAKGSEVLAVQTLRNSLMAATMTASAAVLGLMGTLTLAAPSLHGEVTGGAALAAWTPRLGAALALLVLLFASLAASVFAARAYHHAGFVVGMPVGSDQRAAWTGAGARLLRRAGVLYSWGLRSLFGVAPLLAFILHPLAGPAAALACIVLLHRVDRLRDPDF